MRWWHCLLAVACSAAAAKPHEEAAGKKPPKFKPYIDKDDPDVPYFEKWESLDYPMWDAEIGMTPDWNPQTLMKERRQANREFNAMLARSDQNADKKVQFQELDDLEDEWVLTDVHLQNDVKVSDKNWDQVIERKEYVEWRAMSLWVDKDEL